MPMCSWEGMGLRPHELERQIEVALVRQLRVGL